MAECRATTIDGDKILEFKYDKWEMDAEGEQPLIHDFLDFAE